MGAKNQLLPQLNVGALYSWRGAGDNLISADGNGVDFPARGSTAVENLLGGDHQEVAFFLDFQMPVGFRREMAGVR